MILPLGEGAAASRRHARPRNTQAPADGADAQRYTLQRPPNHRPRRRPSLPRLYGTIPGDAPSVTVCKVPFRPNGSVDPYELPYGWERSIPLLRGAFRSGRSRSLNGCDRSGVVDRHPRDWPQNMILRVRLRYGEPSAQLNTPRERSGNGQIVGRITLVQWDHRIVGKMFGEVLESIKYERHMREYWFQRLFSENPYLLGASFVRAGAAPTLRSSSGRHSVSAHPDPRLHTSSRFPRHRTARHRDKAPGHTTGAR